MNVAVVGGGGHVGLPLGIALADRGCEVSLFDVSETAVAHINAGTMPFDEPGAAEPLRRSVGNGTLLASTDPSVLAGADVVIVVIGTPVDEHLNPDPNAIPDALDACRPFLRDGQLLVLRSTVYPGVTELTEKYLEDVADLQVAYCPERIAEGKAMTELFELPQIIGVRDDATFDRAASLFSKLTHEIVRVTPEEAELAKLFTNTWRYVKFAAANQFFMMANEFGVDYERVRAAIRHDYPRAADLPGAGFAAGPCLLKDTMQLSAFADNQFVLGHSAMLVNEGLPLYLVSRLERRRDLRSETVGVLGMAFKGGSDDTRSSLAYKLKRILRLKAGRVLCADPRVVGDDTLVPVEQLVAESDIVILAAPHPEFADLQFRVDTEVVDVWGFFGDGVGV